MSKTQQEVMIYSEHGFSTAQKLFEKDLRKRQSEGWRLVSITPTKQKYGRTAQLTAIYEREDASVDRALPSDGSSKNTYEEEKDKKSNKKQDGAWSKFKESSRLAAEREKAYQSTLNPEQLRTRKRRNALISGGTILVALLLCIGCGIFANASGNSTMTSAAIPTDTPAPTATSTPTPKPTPTQKPRQLQSLPLPKSHAKSCYLCLL